MLIPTPGKSTVKTGDRRSDPGMSLALWVVVRMEGAVGWCTTRAEKRIGLEALFSGLTASWSGSILAINHVRARACLGSANALAAV